MALQQLTQGTSLGILHGKEKNTVAGKGNIMDGDDILMT